MALPEKRLNREEVYRQIGEYLGESPFGTARFLAVSDLAAHMLREAAVGLAFTYLQKAHDTDTPCSLYVNSGLLREEEHHYLSCLTALAVVSETIRIRKDTVFGYQEALNYVQDKFRGPLLDAEGTKAVSTRKQRILLNNAAAIKLSAGLLDHIRAAASLI